MQNKTFTYVNLPIWTWVKVIFLIAVLSGITSALFLFALRFATDIREENLWIIGFLPFAGILIVFLYNKYGQIAKKGNNLLLEEYYHPKGIIPWIMSPLIVMTTLITHLFGGSAGREGTAVQYGGTYGDKIATYLGLNKEQKRIALLCGVAAGFASLFGTPLAGSIFAIEVFKLGKIRQKAYPIVIITAYLSHFICLTLHAPHSIYKSIIVENYLDINNIWIIIVAILCGLAARLFLLFGDLWTKIFHNITNPYYRICAGSLLLLLLLYFVGNTKYVGLGLPQILNSFEVPAQALDFLLKIIFTTLTLSIGFKGGEVTPLFFIGASLASFLSIYIPLPLMLITAIGFVSVFAGATKTPFACALMAAELFGWSIFPLIIIATIVASTISGRKGIYSSQRNFKSWL